MKSKLLNNLSLKILSVLCAIILWLVVMNVSDYTLTVRIDNIPVQQINGDVLEELDQVYDVEKGDTVDIIVKGRRSVVDKLTASDFIATADLSTMSITNTVQIFVQPAKKTLADEISITYVDNTMQLTLEDKVSVQFPVYVDIEGEPKNGFAICGAVASPNIVTVEGPRSAVDRITRVATVVSADGRDDGYETSGDIAIYDAYGEPIDNNKIVVSHQMVGIKVSIYPKKLVDIVVNVKGRPEDGYAVGEVQYQPQTVSIAGPEDVIADISEINISDISVSGQKENLQTTVNLKNYLPEEVVVAESGSELVVNVSIEKMIEKTLKPSVKDITLTNKQADYTYTLTLSDDYAIIVSGLSHIIDTVDLAVLKPVVDCSDLTEGEHEVTVTMTDDNGLEYEFKGRAVVTVTEK